MYFIEIKWTAFSFVSEAVGGFSAKAGKPDVCEAAAHSLVNVKQSMSESWAGSSNRVSDNKYFYSFK